MKKGLLALTALFILSVMVLLGPGTRTHAEEDLSVTCYKGSSRIGTVVIFDWTTAAVACNATLYDCKGLCMGCFRDFGYVNDVCVDVYGNTFLR